MDENIGIKPLKGSKLKQSVFRCWFHFFFEFSPLLGEDFQFDLYLSDGLVQPPTSSTSSCQPGGARTTLLSVAPGRVARCQKPGWTQWDGSSSSHGFFSEDMASPSLYPWRYSCNITHVFKQEIDRSSNVSCFFFPWSSLFSFRWWSYTSNQKLKHHHAGRSRFFLLWGSIEEVTQTAGLHFLQQAGCLCVCFFFPPPTFWKSL